MEGYKENVINSDETHFVPIDEAGHLYDQPCACDYKIMVNIGVITVIHGGK